MTPEAWLTLAVIVATVYVLVRDLFAPALTLLAAVIILLALGVVTPAQAFSGFSNPAPITVAALYVLAGAAQKTGALQPIVAWVLDRPRGERRTLGRLLVPTAGASAFINNTPVVATLTPSVSEWADRYRISPSRLLMPLSFASILGGMVTLIGTSTNLVVSGLLLEAGYAPFGMFELARVGLPVAVAGLGLLVLLAPALVRERRAPRQQAEEEVREFVVRMRVAPGGPLDGYSVEDAGLRNLSGLFLVEIERERERTAPVGPEAILRGGDLLTFVGRADQVVELQRIPGLDSTRRGPGLRFEEEPERAFFEAVIGEASPLVGETLEDANFRGRYQAGVIAIHRSGERVQEKLGDVELRVGDTLLLLTDHDFGTRWSDRPDFLLVSELDGGPDRPRKKAALVGLVGLGIVGSAAFGLMPILHASLVGALALIGLGVLTPAEARAAVDLDVIIIIAAAFGLGAAMLETGLAQTLAGLLIDGFSVLGPAGVLLGVVLATIAMTNLITNNAAAVLLFPIALAAAERIGADPRAFAIALALAASASFLTPIGYQTNTMVYGAGGYRFGDFARLGLPLTILVVVGVVAVIAGGGMM